MNSIAFPNILSNTSVNIFSDHEATMSNLKLLLLSDKKSLLGDPYFGTSLKKLLFNQNNTVLADLVIDDIYTSIITFIPQLLIDRKNITITKNKSDLYVNIKATNLLDYTTDLYNICLTGINE